MQKNTTHTEEAHGCRRETDGSRASTPEQVMEEQDSAERLSVSDAAHSKLPTSHPKWGGEFIDNIKENDGNVEKYADDMLQVHGLQQAFDETNGRTRTFCYFILWFGLFGLFLWLTVPLIIDYRDRKVQTSVTSVIRFGVPFPILTVCPQGRGIQCDCLLWRRLYCRYLTEGTEEHAMRFGQYACWNNFQLTTVNERNETVPLSPPEWRNPSCSEFLFESVTLEDTCGPTESELSNLPELSRFNGDSLYDAIVSREDGPDGPFITHEELVIYGGVKLAGKVFFYRELDGQVEPLNPRYVYGNYVEWSRLQRCLHVRIPPADTNNRQQFAGAQNGILTLASGIDANSFPLVDMANAAPALKVNINVIREDLYNQTYLFLDRGSFFPVATGRHTTIGYQIERHIRTPGWGPEASRFCIPNPGLPRSICVMSRILTQAAEICNCSGSDVLTEKFLYLSCSATPGTDQSACVREQVRLGLDLDQYPFSSCPHACEERSAVLSSQFSTPLSEAQRNYIGWLAIGLANATGVPLVTNVPDPEKTIMLSVGATTLAELEREEVPVSSVGAILGLVGGNAGLWCGMSLALIAELLEFSFVAVFYGNGFFKRRAKALGASISRSFSNGA